MSPTRSSGVVLPLGLFFFSGAAALVYQVLWVRELRLLFGSTAQSAAIAIAIFFAGIASGGAMWGRRVGGSSQPLRTFGLLEIGVAATALTHFAVVGLYHRIYPSVFGWLGDFGWADLALKTLVATTLLFPAAFLMGGTLPAMSEHLIGRHNRTGATRHPGSKLATTGTTIYAINTIGSATGALAAGFALPQLLGYHGAYITAVGIDLTVGLVAVGFAARTRRAARPPAPVPAPAPRPAATPGPASADRPAVAMWLIWTIAAASGITTLAIEIIWTRLFAQVLQNSAYTFSLVLTTFLVALSAGAIIAGLMARTTRSPVTMLMALLVTAGAATAASPFAFHLITDGLTYIGGDLPWGPYLFRVSAVAVIAMGIPATALGAVLPYLLKILSTINQPPGRIVGRLVAVNTTGAILGSLAGGFVILPALGAWRGLIVLAAVYPVLAIMTYVSTHQRATPRVGSAHNIVVGSGFALASIVALASLSVPLSQFVDAGLLRPGEFLIESRHGPQANVAVVGIGDDLAIRVNTTYTLGGTRGLSSERDQALIPLLTHPDAQSVFFLGMGTGLTAGAALSLPLERVVVCELIDDVVSLSRRHFTNFTNGLFNDPRVTVISEDGRNCLARSDERYDLIISDLFVPWEAGTGYLYTREHYEMSATRLEPGGVYVQWIPLYQVSDQELGIIARTMDDVFDRVVAWRGDLFPAVSALALVGHLDDAPLDPRVIAPTARRIRTTPARSDEALTAMLLRHYAGNISDSAIFADRRISTDSRPLIEQLTPRTQRNVRAGRASFVVAEERERFYADLRSGLPPERDPYLALLDAPHIDAVRSGHIYSLYRLAALREAPDTAALRAAFDVLAPEGAARDRSPSRTLLPRRLSGVTSAAE